MSEIIKEKVKAKFKWVKRILIGMVLLGICGVVMTGTLAFGWMKKQINYTAEEAKSIALQVAPGEVLDTYKELDDLMVVYEVRIRDEQNRLQRIEVNAKYGTIEWDKDSIEVFGD